MVAVASTVSFLRCHCGDANNLDSRLGLLSAGVTFFCWNDGIESGSHLWAATSARCDTIIAVRRPLSNFGFNRLSFNLFHCPKDSTDLDFGLEFDWRSVRIIGEPNLKRPTTLKQPSKD